jgi:hypothetical protein
LTAEFEIPDGKKSLVRIDIEKIHKMGEAEKISTVFNVIDSSGWKSLLLSGSYPRNCQFFYNEIETNGVEQYQIAFSDTDSSLLVTCNGIDIFKKKLKNFIWITIRSPDIPSRGLYEALNSTLTNAGNLQKDLLKRQIKAVYDIFSISGKYYAPYTSLIQSSGFGKSKICLELLKDHYGIYMVFRKPEHTGVPHSAPWVKSFISFVFASETIDDIPVDEKTWKSSEARRFSVGRFLMALSLLIDTYFEEIEYAKQRKISINEAIHIVGSLFMSEPGSDRTLIKMNSLSFNALSLNSITFEQLITKLLKIPAHNNSPFLLFIDEADLLNTFSLQGRAPGINVVRRALHLLELKTNLLVLAIGTNSEVLDFSPSVRENSLRYQTRKNLLLPLFLSCNWDIFSTEYPFQNINLTRNLLCNSDMFKILTVMGRALWSSCPLNDVTTTARAKLINGGEFSLASLFATLLCRANTNVNVHHVLARALIKSHMIIVNYVSTDAKTLAINYSSEPVLAIAARSILSEGNKRELCFFAMRSLIKFHAIDVGRIVENLFEHLCLFSIDDATAFDASVNGTNVHFPLPEIKTEPIDSTSDGVVKSLLSIKRHALELNENRNDSNYNITQSYLVAPEYRVIEVGHFIMSLLGRSMFESVASFIPPSMLHGLVNATHFVNILRAREGDFDNLGYSLPKNLKDSNTRIIDKSLLRCGMLRQAGFVMPPNYFGIDFIIPSCLKVATNLFIPLSRFKQGRAPR